MTRRAVIRLLALPGAEKNSGALLKTRRTLDLRVLFSIFSPEKVAHHAHVAEMEDTARCPDGSRAPRAALVSSETQGTLSPLSSDGENGTRFPLEPFAFGGDSPENSAHFRKTRRNIT